MSEPGAFDNLIFVDFASMTTLPEDQFPAMMFVDQRLHFDGKAMWNRVTPGLLKWMETQVAALKARGGSFERSEEFLMRLCYESGMTPAGEAEVPILKGPPLLPWYSF